MRRENSNIQHPPSRETPMAKLQGEAFFRPFGTRDFSALLRNLQTLGSFPVISAGLRPHSEAVR
jgi:hypothetical protein